MRKLNKQELQLIKDEAPDIFPMVEDAKKRGVSVVLLMIDAFGAKEEAELLQNVIWYVTQEGLSMTFVPEAK